MKLIYLLPLFTILLIPNAFALTESEMGSGDD